MVQVSTELEGGLGQATVELEGLMSFRGSRAWLRFRGHSWNSELA